MKIHFDKRTVLLLIACRQWNRAVLRWSRDNEGAFTISSVPARQVRFNREARGP